MITVDTVARVRRAHFVEGHAIKRIVRDLRLSRNTVRGIIRAGADGKTEERRYERTTQPRPQLGAHVTALEKMLADNVKVPKRERLTAQRMYEELRGLGYVGKYDAVRRYVRDWKQLQAASQAEAYVPLVFAPGEAYQFDWSHEHVLLDGKPVTVRVAQVRLCHSRMLYVRAYFRESQEMVFDAHERAFQFFKGTPKRGIYDNMKTAVDAVFVGKERKFNHRFQLMMDHHLIEPTACTPAAGWEKGQVENQVSVVRGRFFAPKPSFKTLAELNAWLADKCISYAREQKHPTLSDKTVMEVFEAERAVLMAYRGAFDGFHVTSTSVSKTCLVRFDTNRYSVNSKAVGRAVDVSAYADRIVIRQDGVVVGEHVRRFGRDEIAYDPWHYVPVLARKPGALRNGAPFKDWVLPGALEKVRVRLSGTNDGDKQMVKVLSAVLTDGMPAVEAACAEALAAGLANADVILNALARLKQPPRPETVATPEHLILREPPRADCARYDAIRTVPPVAITSSEVRVSMSMGVAHGTH